MFPGTIRENIMIGKLDASLDEVVMAAKAASVHDFITGLPQGYDTKVGERGVLLSGGERQRIAIARALLKDSPVILLDEPASALDSVTEALIDEALGNIIKGRTVIVAAHRLSTIRKADRVIVLDRGRIAESGSHSELIEKAGLYKKLFFKQIPLDEIIPGEGAGANA
jgi:ABC-type multidrug transport system fused ATPase/permease subunit